MSRAWRVWLVLALAGWVPSSRGGDWTLVTLDPGHFHAALFQRSMLPGIAAEAYVYAPLGPDLTAHLHRVAQFNRRPTDPTHWRLRVYAGDDFLDRLWAERPGQIVVLSGRNRDKIRRMQACVERGWHVLADKPWIIESADLPVLEATLAAAARGRVVVYDAMTQRHEITLRLVRSLVGAREVFGGVQPGSREEPAVTFASVHTLLKEVAGVPTLRPAWFFDTAEQGEGLSDVGTHLADLVPWVLFPEQTLDFRTEIEVRAAQRWPTRLSRAEFQRVTGEKDFPAFLGSTVQDDTLDYYANNRVDYSVRGVHVRLQTTWAYASAPGTRDQERAAFRGRRAVVEIRPSESDPPQPEVEVVPQPGVDHQELRRALETWRAAQPPAWAGLGLEERSGRFRLVIPERLRVSHEAHFAQVAETFLAYVKQPEAIPSWEYPNLVAKYAVTTRGVQLARRGPALPPPSP